MKSAIIMAAGKGTRMKSKYNKVMHELIDRPIVEYSIDAAKAAGADRIILVVGHEKESLMEAFPDLEFAVQEPQLGTGHAVMQCHQLEGLEGKTLVMNGDVPCIQPETLEKLFEASKDTACTLLSCVLEDGAHYGRIVRDESGQVLGIKEAKDCTEAEKEIKEINAGIYCFDNKALFDALSKLKNNNAQNEYYLTDVVSILNNEGYKTDALVMEDPAEMAGINNAKELCDAGLWLRSKINQRHLDNGVQIPDPDAVWIGKDVKFGPDVIVYPNTSILGNSVIEEDCQIRSGSTIKDAHVKKGAVTQLCRIENADIDEYEQVLLCSVQGGNSFHE